MEGAGLLIADAPGLALTPGVALSATVPVSPRLIPIVTIPAALSELHLQEGGQACWGESVLLGKR